MSKMYFYSFVTVTVTLAVLIRNSAGQTTDQIKAENDYLRLFSKLIGIFTGICNLVNPLRASFIQNTITKSKLGMDVLIKDRFISFPLENASADISNNATIYNKNGKTLIYIHGLDHAPEDFNATAMNYFIGNKAINLLAYDVTAYTDGPDFIFGTAASPFLGKHLADFMWELIRAGTPLENIHLAGISLGCHVAGYAAREFRKKYGLLLARLTAVEPPAGCFAVQGVDIFNSSDAAFVDTIRTNVASWRPTRYGHADFYVTNRRGSQPGCGDDHLCSHSRSHWLFVESIQNEMGFMARKCSNISIYDCNPFDAAVMGFGANPNTRGDFLLKTNAQYPYAMGLAGLL